METVLHHYIRDAKRNRIGILVSSKGDNGLLKLGWSKLNPIDTFNKEKGLKMAIHRMNNNVPLPDREEVISQVDIDNIIGRSRKYFRLEVAIGAGSGD